LLSGLLYETNHGRNPVEVPNEQEQVTCYLWFSPFEAFNLN
jgi:hypothetical protein